MQKIERSLSQSEKRLLMGRLHALQRRRASVFRHIALAVGIVVGILWAAKLVVSDAPAWIISCFWIALGCVVGFWVFRNESASLTIAMANLQSALRYDHASVVEVQATELVEIEEREDEGACWLF